jgi:hypothetical protein
MFEQFDFVAFLGQMGLVYAAAVAGVAVLGNAVFGLFQVLLPRGR